MRAIQTSRCVLALAVVSGLPVHPAAGQAAAQDSAWDVTRPRGQTREIDFTTTEGTWMSLDVSPDGAWVVFDLLGHIYRMPIGGGNAECLTQGSGVALNVQPRFSPDGRTIAFISDRKGQMNVWQMDSDGKNPAPVLLDDRYEYRWPSWSADGRFVVAVRRAPFTVGGFGSLMLLNRSGGSGVELLKGEGGRNPFRMSMSDDGRYAYFDVYTGTGGGMGRSDVLRGAVQLHRLDLTTGTVSPLTAGQTEQGNADHPSSGGAYAAEPSPDGRSLAFLRKVPGGTLEYKGQRYGPRSALWVRELVTGEERMVMDAVEMDLSETSFPLDGTYPSYAWTPDSRSIVILRGGKIRRVDVTTGAMSTIPFSVRVQRTISGQPVATTRLSDGPVEARFIRGAASSPDGKTLAFHAFGRIWLVESPGAAPRRLTPDSFAPFEYQPAWSPDGKSIAFTSWHDRERGALWVASVSGGGAPRRLTRVAGEYLNPAWTPDGREVVAARGAGATARGQTMLRNPYYDIVRVPAEGGEDRFVVQLPRGTEPYGRRGELARPTVGTNGRIYFAGTYAPGSRDGVRPYTTMDVESVRPDGSDRRVHARVANGGDAVVSPDGRWLAFTQGMNTYLAPLPENVAAGTPPVINRRGGDFATVTLSTEGGIDPHWRSDGVVEFVSGNSVFAHDVAKGRTDTTAVKLTVPRDVAPGAIALTGARIVTLDQKRVIENGTVVVRAGRIACVGQCQTTGVDRVVDASGTTIIPGYVDLHAHHEHEHLGMLPAHNFETSVYLAYGVTTTFDPSPTSTDPLPAGELVEAGQMLGPRIFTSAETFMFGDDPSSNAITSLAAARTEVARRKAWGVPMLKQYLQPLRQARQWIIEAARQLGVRSTAEGSADLYHRLSMVLDGYNGGEHMVAQAPLYADVLTLMAKAGYVYSHTPLVAGYGAWTEEYFWQQGPQPLWQDAKLQRWIPWRELIPHTRRFIMRPETDYSKDVVAQVAADLLALGGSTAIGSHGQQHGLGSHWDVWMLAKTAGPMTALEVATMHGARFLGMDADLGSITVGKLGDLMVLNGNPLDDIRKTADIRYVMKAGVLYDATSLDQIWPKSVKYGDYYWVVPEMFRVDEKRVDVPDGTR